MKRYQEIADQIRQRIEAGTLRAGEKLPSVRQMRETTGYSMTTIQHAYTLLEGNGVIDARPRRGFFISDNMAAKAEFCDDDHTSEFADQIVSIDELAFRVTSLWHRKEFEAFGAIYPSTDITVREKIDQHLRYVLRSRAREMSELDSPEGDPVLREVIARRAVLKGIIARSADVAIVGRGIQGLDLCIEAVTSPGDIVLVESPSFFPIFASLQRQQLKAIEIYSHPRFGIDPAQFDYLLRNNPIRACVLMPVHHYPTGITYPAETMQSVVRTASHFDVPIVEIDLFSQLTHREEIVPSLKQFDERDLVLHFSSLSDLSAHGYGVSSVISSRYQPVVTRRRFMNVLASGDGIVQRAIAEYMTESGYDKQLRRVRAALTDQVVRGLQLIAQHFPSTCAVSRPTGGFMCWIRGPRGFDALQASKIAFADRISLPPGPMFSVTKSFDNFVALNLSLSWSEEHISKLKKVAGLLRSLSRAHMTINRDGA
jgi:DNA-binding transcriptional MocR family regulator